MLPPHIIKALQKWQRWSAEDWKGGGGVIFPQYVRQSLQFLSLATDAEIPWAYKLQVAAHTSNCPRHDLNISPPIYLSHLTTNWPDLWQFHMNSLLFNKEYHCNKNGAKRSSNWPSTSFWPISLKKSAKGLPKRVENQVPPNPVPSIPKDFLS